MEKTASLETVFSCRMFSKSIDKQKIAQSFQRHPHFTTICTQLEQIQHMFQRLQKDVPQYSVPEARKYITMQRLQSLNTTTVGNVVHVPFTKQPAPMYIVLCQSSSEEVKAVLLQILPLIELCAHENRDCYVLAGAYDPIVFKQGIMSYDSFIRFMSLDEVAYMYPFERLVKHSIAKPFTVKSDIVIVHAKDEALQLSKEDYDLFLELKDVFQCSVKALVFNDKQLKSLSGLLDEVYIMPIENK